jgi:hypothetical protein
LNSLAAPLPSTVAYLGYGGLIPFVLLAAAVLVGGDYAGFCSHALFSYGAVILSFVGALHWAFAMLSAPLSDRDRNATWGWSVVPALLAWLALLVTPAAAGLVLIGGFLAQYIQDRRLASRTPLPAWYLPLRLRLTTVACACLAAGAFAAHQWTAQP